MVYFADLKRTTRLLEQVEVLPRHEFGAHLVVDALGRGELLCRKAAGEELLVRPRQAQVTQQDRGPHAEGLGGAEPFRPAVQHREAVMGRGHPAAGVGAVHDVVVDERAGLQEFQG
jgi:hypothetical protein